MSPLIALPLCILFAWFFYGLALDMWDGGCGYLWLYRIASVLSVMVAVLAAVGAVGSPFTAMRFNASNTLLAAVVPVPAAMICWFIIRAWIRGGRCSFCHRRAPRLEKICPHCRFQ